jgi:DNA-nicking Smr family endonuclease
LRDKISDKDKKDWENFLSNKEKLPDKDLKKIKKKNSKIKNIDLHGYSLEEANRNIKKLILDCYNNEVSKLIVVTGKGLHSDNYENPYLSKDLSILKYSVPEFIKNDQELMKLILEIREAKIEDGGSGSFYVYLKKKK